MAGEAWAWDASMTDPWKAELRTGSAWSRSSRFKMTIRALVAAIIGLAAIIALVGMGILCRLPPVRAAVEWQDAGAPSQARSIWGGVYTKEQAKRGGEIYRVQCAACHGVTLNGGE